MRDGHGNDAEEEEEDDDDEDNDDDDDLAVNGEETVLLWE